MFKDEEKKFIILIVVILIFIAMHNYNEQKSNGDPPKEMKEILPRIGCLIESTIFYPNLTGTENLKIFTELPGLRNYNYIKSALEFVNLYYMCLYKT